MRSKKIMGGREKGTEEPSRCEVWPDGANIMWIMTMNQVSILRIWSNEHASCFFIHKMKITVATWLSVSLHRLNELWPAECSACAELIPWYWITPWGRTTHGTKDRWAACEPLGKSGWGVTLWAAVQVGSKGMGTVGFLVEKINLKVLCIWKESGGQWGGRRYSRGGEKQIQISIQTRV